MKSGWREKKHHETDGQPIEIEALSPMRVIGHSHPRPDVVDKVTGAARFADDIAFPGMLYG